VIRSDVIYEFEHGKVKAFGTFDELRDFSASFNDLATVSLAKQV
jgi:hypothetical protein